MIFIPPEGTFSQMMSQSWCFTDQKLLLIFVQILYITVLQKSYEIYTKLDIDTPLDIIKLIGQCERDGIHFGDSKNLKTRIFKYR